MFFFFSSFSLILDLRSDDDILGLKRVNLFASVLCRALLLFVLARPVHSSQCFAHAFNRQTPGSAKRNWHISQLGLVSRPATSGRLARLFAALGVVQFQCTGRQRASADHRVMAPASCRASAASTNHDRSCRVAAMSTLRCASSNSSCESGRRGTRAQCAWLVANRQQARTGDSEREWHTARLGVPSWWCRSCYCARCARERSSTTRLSQRELPHIGRTEAQAHDALLHLCSSAAKSVSQI
jgi:hypothetical protein